MAITKSNKQWTLTWPKQGTRVVDAHLTLGIQLEEDSHKKSLKSQSSLGSCFSLATQSVSQLFKWVRDLSWTRWRSINTPHEVQGSANGFTLKTGSPDARYVEPDALHWASGDSKWLTIPSLTGHRTLLPSIRCYRSVRGWTFHPPWV